MSKFSIVLHIALCARMRVCTTNKLTRAPCSFLSAYFVTHPIGAIKFAQPVGFELATKIGPEFHIKLHD